MQKPINYGSRFNSTVAEAAFYARNYHGGQGCGLYALASSGVLVTGIHSSLMRASTLAASTGDYDAESAFDELLRSLVSGAVKTEVML